MDGTCPVCETPVENDLEGELANVDCARCGSYKITDTAIRATEWAKGLPDEQIRRAKVSFALRRM